jgi:hypothetical protein
VKLSEVGAGTIGAVVTTKVTFTTFEVAPAAAMVTVPL